MDDLVKRSDQVERVIRELNAAFIDATIHAQDAFALVKYVRELEAANPRIAQLEAARIAYASEFAPDAEGLPDVGSIHANIRVVKRDLAFQKQVTDAARQMQIELLGRAEGAERDADRLMAACRRAILALAHAAEKDPVYQPAYEALDAVMVPGRGEQS